MRYYGDDIVTKEQVPEMELWKPFQDKATGLWGYSYEGKIVVPTIFNSVPNRILQECNLIPVKITRNGEIRTGYFDVRLFQHIGGVEIKYDDREYEVATQFYNGYASVCIGGKYSIINEEGKNIAHFVFDEVITKHSDGLMAVRSGDKWGFINLSTGEFIHGEYDAVDLFDRGLARVKINGKWGVINKEGELVVKCKYSEDELRNILNWDNCDEKFEILADAGKVQDIKTIYTLQTKTMIAEAKSEEVVEEILKVYKEEMQKLIEERKKVLDRLAQEAKQKKALQDKKDEAISEIDEILEEANLVEEGGLNV